jgi:hypothetical protein
MNRTVLLVISSLVSLISIVVAANAFEHHDNYKFVLVVGLSLLMWWFLLIDVLLSILSAIRNNASIADPEETP